MNRELLLKGRTSIHNHAYHVTTCTKNRKLIFNDFSSARILINEMKSLEDKRLVSSIAWVLMPDHLHWLFQLSEISSLSKVVKTLKGSSACKINQQLGNNTSIWQKGYYDHAIRTDEDLKHISRYIVANPLRANLVSQIGDYPYWDAIWL